MSSASWALQTAIFAKLSADTSVKAVLGNPSRLYDEVPRNGAMPYLVIGDDKESDWSTSTDSGTEHALVLHVWSRARGRKESKSIADVIRASLDDATLTPAGHTLIDIKYQSAEFLRQTDGQTYHAIIRFRAVTEPT
ncbi:MAG TPA: DUF3168 domain-containing protein [Rhizomicrobium sp.]|jgi:hypothetical protein